MAFRPRLRCHLPGMQEVGFYVVLTPFALPPPPSHARARRRWIFRGFNTIHFDFTSLACKSETGVGLWPFSPVRVAATALAGKSETEVEFMSFRPRSRCRYLPRMQETGGLYLPFDPIHAAATSLAYNSESDVSFHGLALPLPPHATASWRWFVWPFNSIRAAAISLTCNSKQVLER